MFIQYKIMSTTHQKQAPLFRSPYSLDSTSCKLTTEQIITHEKLKPLYIALMGELGETPSYDAVVEEGCVREGVVKTLLALQSGIETLYGPNIIHIYPAAYDKVNKDIWGCLPNAYPYLKVSLFSNDKLSLALFKPMGRLAFTPPHSHHVQQSISSTSPHAHECMVSIHHDSPTMIAEDYVYLSPGVCINTPEDGLLDHMVFWSSEKLNVQHVSALIKDYNAEQKGSKYPFIEVRI